LKDYARTVKIKPSEGAAWTNMGQIHQEREEWAEVRSVLCSGVCIERV
jgi:hypothetical protein